MCGICVSVSGRHIGKFQTFTTHFLTRQNATDIHRISLVSFSCSPASYDHSRSPLTMSFVCQQVTLTRFALTDTQSQQEQIFIASYKYVYTLIEKCALAK
jgi:hypothetical protein